VGERWPTNTRLATIQVRLNRNYSSGVVARKFAEGVKTKYYSLQISVQNEAECFASRSGRLHPRIEIVCTNRIRVLPGGGARSSGYCRKKKHFQRSFNIDETKADRCIRSWYKTQLSTLNVYLSLCLISLSYFRLSVQVDAFQKYVIKLKLSHYTPWRRLGERRYSSYSFSIAALDGGE
jgi:hypothetical protein